MSQMLDEIRQQPDMLNTASLEIPRPEARGETPLIVFVARGSSDHACLYARYLFETRLRIPCSLAAPSVITRYHAELAYPEGALVIGVSQSAAAPDVAAVLKHAKSRGCETISITNAEDGPVIEEAQTNVFLKAGKEHAVAATKTFTLTLLAFYQLARQMGANLPAPDFGDAPARAIEHPAAKELARKIAESDLTLSLGRGYHFAIALEAALKLMECALVPCKPYSLADLAHGPLALAAEGMSALVFGRPRYDDTSEQILIRLEEAGAALCEAPDFGLSEELAPIPAAIFAQRVAYETALLRGLDPDEPRHIRKITRTR